MALPLACRSQRLLLLGLLTTFLAIPSAYAASTKSYMGSIAVLGVSVMTGLLVQHNKLAPVYIPEQNSMAGKTVVITGANTGLGLESAKRLAAAGAKVVLTVRSEAKGEAAVRAVQQYVKERTGQDAAQATFKVLQLDNLDSIRKSVATWTDLSTIDVLMNNAGLINGKQLQHTNDGIEYSFQTNHLGHFLLTALLKDKLSNAARIINVSSDLYKSARHMNFDYAWEPSDRKYSAMHSYAQSKLANILFSQELQRRAEAAGTNWTVSSCHPGVVATDGPRRVIGVKHDMEALKRGEGSTWETLVYHLLTLFLRSNEQGATTQVWLAAGAPGADARGKYFVDCKARTMESFAKDPEAAKMLFEQSEARAGVSFDLQSKESTLSTSQREI